jgi:hypothetical protein
MGSVLPPVVLPTTSGIAPVTLPFSTSMPLTEYSIPRGRSPPGSPRGSLLPIVQGTPPGSVVFAPGTTGPIGPVRSNIDRIS